MSAATHAPEQWVLVGTRIGGPLAGRPLYHLSDALIGPASTSDIHKAQIFGSREEACQSLGFRHWSSTAVPMRLADALEAAKAEA